MYFPEEMKNYFVEYVFGNKNFILYTKDFHVKHKLNQIFH